MPGFLLAHSALQCHFPWLCISTLTDLQPNWLASPSKQIPFLSQNHQLPAGEISCSFKLLSFLSCQSSHPGSPTPSTVGTAPGTHLPTIPPCFQGFSNAARAEGRSHREGGSETPTLSATLSLQLKELCKDARGSHTLSSSHYQAPATGGLCIQHLLI